jgi:hypothetical protein
MPSITTIIEELLVALIIDEKLLRPRRNKVDLVLTTLSILLGSIAIVLLLIGLKRFLETIYSPTVAIFILAGLTLGVTIIITLIAYRFRQPPQTRLNTLRHSFGQNIHTLIKYICDETTDPIKKNPKMAILVAAIAGFLVDHYRSK